MCGRAIWFYFGKLLWPANLVFTYPRWYLDATVWWQWLFPVAAIAATVALWAIRHRSRAPLAGWLYFVGTLFPALGFLNVFPFIYSFVADHFQYLAGLGMIVPVAAGITLAVNRMEAGTRAFGRAACGTLVFLLLLASIQQSAMYADEMSLYQTTIQRNPECWLAYNNLARTLVFHHRDAEALPLFEEAVRLRPDYAEALTSVAQYRAEDGAT